MKELILIHGRSQQNKNASALKEEWIEAWEQGLQKSGLNLPLPKSSIHFPYYGNTLAQLAAGLPADQAADVIIRGEGANDAELNLQMEILNEMRAEAGITQAEVEAEMPPAAAPAVLKRGLADWKWTRGLLQVIDRRLPFGSSGSIALFTRDVHHYLKNPAIRSTIHAGVRAAFTGAPAVVVAHSLGSVVAYELLRDEAGQGGWKIPTLVTLGSPLAIQAISAAVSPRGFPHSVGQWFNARDPRDIVALRPLNAANGWATNPAIENKEDVVNQTSNRHGIAGYLSDPVIAKRIHDALKA